METRSGRRRAARCPYLVACVVFISVAGNRNFFLRLRPASSSASASASASALRPSGAGKDSKSPPPPPAHAGSLNCSAHGGPSDDAAAEMVYWSDIASDRAFASPFHSNDTAATKYLTFELDFGGFNNARMAFETTVLLAHSMGRTLVLPPSQGAYWLDKPFSFYDFYDIDKISSEHAGLDIITTEQFLQREGMAGNLKNKDSGASAYPPNNRTKWDGRVDDEYKRYVHSVAFIPENWRPGECLASFPNGTAQWHYPVMKWFLRNVTNSFRGPYPHLREYLNNPSVPVDAQPTARLREAIVAGYGGAIRRLCLYDEPIQEKRVIHFPCCKREQRLLAQHYSFLFFWDWTHDLWSKRFVRDNLRFRDAIQCAAARVVNAIRLRARHRDGNNSDGEYDSFHIRRGDLVKQYRNTDNSADVIYRNAKDELVANATVFVATDEKERDFFAPLASSHDVVFLGDFQGELQGIDKSYYGMIDQMVAARGRTFFGCYQSTFSNFIFRMRAWRSQRDKLEGHLEGTFDRSFYYTQPNLSYVYRNYSAINYPSYMREFPIGWKNMDKGIGVVGSGYI